MWVNIYLNNFEFNLIPGCYGIILYVGILPKNTVADVIANLNCVISNIYCGRCYVSIWWQMLNLMLWQMLLPTLRKVADVNATWCCT